MRRSTTTPAKSLAGFVQLTFRLVPVAGTGFATDNPVTFAGGVVSGGVTVNLSGRGGEMSALVNDELTSELRKDTGRNSRVYENSPTPSVVSRLAGIVTLRVVQSCPARHEPKSTSTGVGDDPAPGGLKKTSLLMDPPPAGEYVCTNDPPVSWTTTSPEPRGALLGLTVTTLKYVGELATPAVSVRISATPGVVTSAASTNTYAVVLVAAPAPRLRGS
jgi:hypothetical protein